MKIRCRSCNFEWEAARIDSYLLRCGFCGNLTCERCGRHEYARMHVCTECYSRKGADLEDIFVGTCESCGWVRPVGVVGGGRCDQRTICHYCRQHGVPDSQPENPEAFTMENFLRRVNHYFPPEDRSDPGSDLLPLTLQKFQLWDKSIQFEKRELGFRQAAFYRDQNSVEGLIGLYDIDKYKFAQIALTLGRINSTGGNRFLFTHVENLTENPYYAGLALEGLCESPCSDALKAWLWIFSRNHFSINRQFCLEQLLKMENRLPGFLFSNEVIEMIRPIVFENGFGPMPQHLAYFIAALEELV